MIQFNLLPDVKLEYIRSKRTKHSVILIATIVAGSSLAIFVLLFLTVNVLQKQHLDNLQVDIDRDSNTLKSVADLDRVLTVQNQLTKLTELHNAKPVMSRLKGFIAQVTPEKVSYASIDIDLEANTIKVTGSADSLKTVNQFVDTLKFTEYQTGDSAELTPAFSEVVLTTFGKNEDSAQYEINFKFDPVIFSSKSQVKLVVPKIITTRSEVEKPSQDLIVPFTNTTDEGGQ
jgi:Tfp pilus assembly protein PilN